VNALGETGGGYTGPTSALVVFSMSATVPIDSILVAVIGVGINVVIGLLLHLIKVGNGVVRAPGLVVISVLTTLVFANGIRGAIAYRKFTASL